jgi:hypothetical protein
MSLSHRIILPLAIVSLALLVACGNNGAPNPNKNGYTNSDLSGTYVLSFSGSDVNLNTQTESFFAIAGTITADGNGNISGGTVDINDANLGGAGVFTAQALTASTYTINSDGRGTGSLVTPQGTFGIDFVLTSDSHGLIMRFDNGGSGSGTLDLQGTALQGQLSSLAFTMLGTEFNSDLAFNPVGTVGAVSLNPGSGAINSGIEDFNDTGSSAGITDLTLTGNLVIASGGNFGTATFNTSFAAMTFDVWVIDSTHLKLIETDTTSGLALAGDAFPQQSSFSAGQLVFAVAGADTGIQYPFAAGGYVTTDANGNLTNGIEDFNDGGNPNTVSPFTGTCNATAPFVGDRCQLTLTAFTNGLSTTLTFAAYPSAAGVLLLENDSSGSFLQGAAYTQLATAFGTPEAYGFNLTGFNDDPAVGADGKVDQIGEFNATTSNLNGVVDENDVGALQTSSSLSGTYAPDSPATGRGSITVTTPRTYLGSLGLEYYVIDSSSTIFIEGDLDQVSTGVFELQSSPGASVSKAHKAAGASSAASSIVSLTRTFSKSHMATKRRNQ